MLPAASAAAKRQQEEEDLDDQPDVQAERAVCLLPLTPVLHQDKAQNLVLPKEDLVAQSTSVVERQMDLLEAARLNL